jgi:hypothetical protein
MKIFAFALLLAGAASAQTFHTFQVPGCDATAPAALNDLSEVVGTATCNGLSTAFIRDAAGHFTTFTIDGAPTTATGINIHGAVVGFYTVTNCQGPLPGFSVCQYSFVRSPQGVITTIQSENPMMQVSYPVGINDKGQIAGASLVARIATWFRDSDGTWMGIGFPNGPGAAPCCINNVPEIAIAISPAVGQNSAITLNPLKYITPGFPPQLNVTYWGPANAFNIPVGISNNGGYMVGITRPQHSLPSEPSQVFIQSAVGSPLLVSVPSPGAVGGINILGEAVIGGNSYIPAGGTPIPIIISGGENVTAAAINDLGWVTGSYTVAGQAKTAGFLWRK